MRVYLLGANVRVLAETRIVDCPLPLSDVLCPTPRRGGERCPASRGRTKDNRQRTKAEDFGPWTLARGVRHFAPKAVKNTRSAGEGRARVFGVIPAGVGGVCSAYICSEQMAVSPFQLQRKCAAYAAGKTLISRSERRNFRVRARTLCRMFPADVGGDGGWAVDLE